MGSDRSSAVPMTPTQYHGMDREQTKPPLISVIIPTKNSERTIRECLQSVRAQTYGNVEIIVVDNFSSDSTVRVAKKYADTVLMGGPERGSQVKLGVAHCKGDFVYKIDSDFVLEPNVLEKAIKVALEENAVGVIIPNLSDPKISFWSKVRFFERLSYVGSSQIEAARFFRRDVYDKVGGHDTNIVAYEEHDLHNRVSKQGKISRAVGVAEWHIGEPRTLAEIAAKHWYYGKAAHLYEKKYPSLASTQLLSVRRSLLRQRVTWFRQPKLLLGLIVYDTVKYVSAAFGLLTELI